MAATKHNTLKAKTGRAIRKLVSCCCKDRERRPKIQISAPTNFRREEVSLPGLDAFQQQFIREKSSDGAHRMWTNLRPIHGTSINSSSSQTLTALNEVPPQGTLNAPPSPLARVRTHSRKISDSLRLSINGGYHAISTEEADVHG